MSPSEIVDAFITACSVPDLAAATELVSDDVEYENVGMTLTTGSDQLRGILEPFVAGFDEVDWVVHHQVAEGEVVMNERTDRFRKGDDWLELRVMGVFVVRDGRIVIWRDYFDVATLTEAMTRFA